MTRLWTELRAPEFAELSQDTIAILPVGSAEQHGPHLPLNTDFVVADSLARDVVAGHGDDLGLVLLPSMAVSKSNEHAWSPGTLWLSAATLLTVLDEIARCVATTPVRKLVFLNGHGGNSALLQVASRDVRLAYAHNLDVINIRPDAWFATEEVEPGTWLVSEPGHVNCFLVEGTERAVLVDTGLGIADIGSAARQMTDKPILVVNTHSHSDHRGGNWRFTDVAAHPLAAGTLTGPVGKDQLAGYLEVAREQLAAYQRAREADDRFFHLFTATTRPRPLPEEASRWAVPGGPAPTPLADGERIGLGGRELTVLHTPGHSADSLCLLDERACCSPATR